MSKELTNKEKRDLILEAGMNLIPYVGGSMASLYFGSKEEKRFKRLESFYQELAQEIKSMKDSLGSIEEQNPIAFEAIMESLHEKVEIEPTEEKRQFFKNYFKNTLKEPILSDFDERKYFLETLHDMSLLECEILAFIKNQSQQIQVGNINKPNIEQYAIVGAIGRLKSRGFLTAMQGSFSIGGGEDNSLQEIISISPFGSKFCTFCLDT
ncbi:hypothetical protein LPB137_08350 [Poseidonibacter parvus]|uniref:DUF4393 domain-containing protein n=1 Tax=Poseidonibacter parvus TaxID=1850254 RepID=A0A1P8KMW2_9BACT|nr:hypothetical protein [Poseidonibacter parvus]APW65865.1 hypothetical protein LPB137_08350 [Poseidonibacter parvus]